MCRHGSTDGNVDGGFLSSSDPPLNALGRAQSERVRAALQGVAFGAAFVSPMRRCRETLAIVAPQVRERIDDALREVDFGSWEGRTLAWLEANDPDGVAQRRRDPVSFRPAGGESFRDVAQRLQPFVDTTRAGLAHNILIVGHRGTLGVLERLLRDLPLESRDVLPLEPGEYRFLDGANV